MTADVDMNVNAGASTSAACATNAAKSDARKKNLPWIEKYRPQKFEEIMGKSNSDIVDFCLLIPNMI